VNKIITLACVALLAAAPAFADTLTITIHLTSDTGVGESIGTVVATDTPYGLLLTPDLKGLAPGLHGFHVHENGSCQCSEKDGKMVPGLSAGGHYDPAKTGKHLGPYSADGHLGDLPPLYVAADGSATLAVLAPRLKVKDLKGRAVMVHAGGDNFSDQPAALGGGGARVACGVIE
jgi:Cu-Zn family superoxide dismutase